MATPSRLIIGISGASGVIHGVRLLELLRPLDIEAHLVMSKTAELTLAYETDYKPAAVRALADAAYAPGDLGAAPASGSFTTLGMIVAPCSIRSMSEIATGVTSGLLTRAADVVLKERRTLLIAIRETPLHAGHLESLLRLSRMGAVIFPPVPAFYNRPVTLQDIVDQSCMRMLDQFEIHIESAPRWGEEGGVPAVGQKIEGGKAGG